MNDPFRLFLVVPETEVVVCSQCHGKKKIELRDPDGKVWTTINCPECSGTGVSFAFKQKGGACAE